MSIPLCWLSLGRLLSAFMIIQIVFQFIPQVLAVFAIRKCRRQIALPFHMWLYPVPALVALIGWIYVATAPEQHENIGTALILLLLGIGAFFFVGQNGERMAVCAHGDWYDDRLDPF